ncbi:MAG: helix-turn-helix transcriptional regulator [Candidatus Acidiferrales bacterium]
MIERFEACVPTAYDSCRRTQMVIGDKLKELRATKNLSQGDIEKRTGLLRCYISRVENGHTVPSVDTLEKMARALEIPMYRLFTDDEHVKKPNIPISNGKPALNKKQDAQLRPFTKALSRMNDKDQRLLLHMASKMANRG